MNTFKKIGIVAVVMVMICMLPVAAMAFNRPYIAGTLVSGSTSWDAATSTFTLTDAQIDGFIEVLTSCKIELVGNNTITSDQYGIYVASAGEEATITFTGTGTLTINSSWYALYGPDNNCFVFESGTVNANTTSQSDEAVFSANSIHVDKGATLTATSNAPVAVSASTALTIDGTLIASTTAPNGVAVNARKVTINGEDVDPDILAGSGVEVNKPAPVPAPIPAAPISAPKTGDSTPVILLASLMLMSAAVLFVSKKRTA